MVSTPIIDIMVKKIKKTYSGSVLKYDTIYRCTYPR